MGNPSDLAQRSDDKRSLSELQPNENAAILELQGGYGFRSRLAALGFTPGTGIRMLRNLRHGPVIVTVRDTRIVLGRQEAERVLVSSAGHDNDSTSS